MKNDPVFVLMAAGLGMMFAVMMAMYNIISDEPPSETGAQTVFTAILTVAIIAIGLIFGGIIHAAGQAFSSLPAWIRKRRAQNP